jgi:hypothetical protein
MTSALPARALACPQPAPVTAPQPALTVSGPRPVTAAHAQAPSPRPAAKAQPEALDRLARAVVRRAADKGVTIEEARSCARSAPGPVDI